MNADQYPISSEYQRAWLEAERALAMLWVVWPKVEVSQDMEKP